MILLHNVLDRKENIPGIFLLFNLKKTIINKNSFFKILFFFFFFSFGGKFQQFF
jgi:hypothetical protein